MIFSTDNCPICGKKLKLEIVEGEKPNTVGFVYVCEKKEIVRNPSDTFYISRDHYENRVYKGGSLCFMVLPPYCLVHSAQHKSTAVHVVSGDQPKKLLFTVPLLDLDYSQPQVVLARLKLLVTFS